MSTFGHNQPQWHSITGGRFVCTAPEDAPCRSYPTCECENWNSTDPEDADPDEHACLSTSKAGQPCWIGGWIDAVGLDDCYDGRLAVVADDDVDVAWPDGPIVTDWDDSVMWTYVGGES